MFDRVGDRFTGGTDGGVDAVGRDTAEEQEAAQRAARDRCRPCGGNERFVVLRPRALIRR
ncbi:hypothetical protein [Vulcanimicrobium alpinum]|uniref:hypothetical protein n=1 Tax=Vulcanimicrobium alpinum TaxID=3016050 RepID=UPI00295EA0A4|nr:hypothetical protein [Vulcanimicrobium alpinum]